MAAMDMHAFNEVFNKLKEIVGPHGAFVLFACKQVEGDITEDAQLRVHGVQTRVQGLFGIGSRWIDNVAAGFDEQFKRTHDPD